MRIFTPFLCLILLAACLPINYTSAPGTPENLSIVYTPSLGWMQDTLHLCASINPKIALTVEERPISALEVGAAETILKLGSIPNGILEGATVTLLGWEEIVIISSPKIAPSQLELPDVQILYTSLEPDYQAWAYPQGSELYQIFSETILPDTSPSPHVKIAPSPQAMLEMIANQSEAVGFIPQSWLAENQPINVIREGYPKEFRQPILALTSSEPTGIRREFLHCLDELLP